MNSISITAGIISAAVCIGCGVMAIAGPHGHGQGDNQAVFAANSTDNAPDKSCGAFCDGVWTHVFLVIG